MTDHADKCAVAVDLNDGEVSAPTPGNENAREQAGESENYHEDI